MAKKVLFYTKSLNYRGVCNSILDYAKYNEEILGNESAIIYNPYVRGFEPDVVLAIEKRFKLLKFADWFEVNKIASKYDVFYAQKLGRKEPPFIQSTKSVVHAVFQFDEPHGDVYAYISEWLADWMHIVSGNVMSKEKKHPWVPYIVHLPTPDLDAAAKIRTSLGIRQDQFVFGRLGAPDSFDIPFVHETIKKVVATRDDIVFVFPYTEPFHEHANIHYMPPFFDQQTKSNYIAACDAMIHARRLGESFGLAIHEFLYHNKPVLAWENGDDRNHIRVLEPFKLLYNEDTLMNKIETLKNKLFGNYNIATTQYTPEKVMAKFDKVFLQ